MKEDIAKLLSPPRKAKLHESIVSQLKGLIHSKKLAVDDKLPSERELANLFSVSRVVVRESIQALEQAGLIEIRTGPSGGAFVVRTCINPWCTLPRTCSMAGSSHCSISTRRAGPSSAP